MFKTLLASLVGSAARGTGRTEGAAFLKVARDLHQLTGLAYLCVNVPIASGAARFAHCAYSDKAVRHCISNGPVSVDRLGDLGLIGGPVDWEPGEWCARFGSGHRSVDRERALTFPFPPRQGESAVFGVAAEAEPAAWHEKKGDIMREIRILGDYFHSHILRINGHNSDAQILISAKELDCLKWTAAGKTAWEASVILGISERTVRFHLNAAREKLDCATTTQAVAKAITQHLIDQ